jgi:hypothetical protein
MATRSKKKVIKSAPKKTAQLRKSTAKPRYSDAMIEGMFKRLQFLEKRETQREEMGKQMTDAANVVMNLTGELNGVALDTRQAGAVGMTHNQAAADRVKLPSSFQINAPVFMRYGDAFLPATVIGVRFTDSEVSYDLAPAGNIFGAVVNAVWSGYVSARDPEQQWSSTNTLHGEIPKTSDRT